MNPQPPGPEGQQNPYPQQQPQWGPPPQQPYGQQYPPQQYPQQPYGGYPQQPQWGPPPKKRGLGWPVAILLIVAVVAAGGVFAYIKLVKNSDDDPQGKGGKPAPVSTGDDGQVELSGSPVYNACNLIDHADVSTVFGRLADGAYVNQSYSEPAALPKTGQDGGTPTWTYGLDSDCSISGGAGADGPIGSVDLRISQSSAADSVNSAYQYALKDGKAAPFSKDASVQKVAGGERYESLVWKNDTAVFVLGVTGAYQKPLPNDDQLAKLLAPIKERLKNPDPNPRKVAISIGAYKVRDVCALWTADDFVKTLKTPADPTNVQRRYPVASSEYGYEASCQRNNAASSGDIPLPPGAKYIEGGINPEITVQDYADAGTADKQYKDALEQGQFNAIGGMGAPASFGIYANAYEIVVRKDRTVLTIRLGSTVGTADYTPAQMQTLLTPVAKDVLGKL